MKKLCLVLVVLALMSAASTAWADVYAENLTVDFLGVTESSRQAVTITGGASVWAGVYNYHLSGWSPTRDIDYAGFCIQSNQPVDNSSKNWKVVSLDDVLLTTEPSMFLGDVTLKDGSKISKASAVARIWTEYTADHSLNPVAAQIAIWEVLNETSSSLSVSGGTFTANTASGQMTIANDYLGNLGGTTPETDVYALWNASEQDGSIVISGNLSVPEPMAIVNLVAVAGIFGGAGLIRWRRRK